MSYSHLVVRALLLMATSSGVTEGGQTLRNLVLPSTLVDHFVAIASPNTDKGIETCGFLLGGLASSRFVRLRSSPLTEVSYRSRTTPSRSLTFSSRSKTERQIHA